MRPFKKIAAIAMSLALTAAFALPTGVRAEETVAPIPDIRISIAEGQDAPVYQAEAQEQNLTIKLENTGKADAKNVKITPVLNDASEWPFDMEKLTNEVTVGDIPAGASGEAIWKDLTVRSEVGNNTVRLFFKITCDDGSQNQFETNKYVFVKTTVKPEEKPEDPEPETPPVEEAPPEDGGISNSEPVATGGGGGSESGANTVPRVIVTGFNTEPAAVNAGSDFKLIIHLKNTSGRTAVSNMLFDLQAPSSGSEGAAEAPAFLPSSGSSSIFLDSIPAGGTQDISIQMNARADLVQKPYSIAMSMKYEDNKAAQFESSSSLAIPVKQAARFEFSELEIAPQTLSVGEEANITCSLYNTGRIKLYNVKANFQGDGIEGKDVFVGNIDPGATGSIDGIVTATKEMMAGEKCKMVVTYEDDAGKVSTVEKEFTLEVMPEAPPMDMTQMTDVPVEKPFPVIPVAIGAAVAVAAIIILIVVLKKRKKKKESVEEEDLLDEVDRFTEDE